MVARKPQEAQKTAVLGPPSSTARGRPNAHRSDLSLLPGLRVHLEAPPRPDSNRVSPRVHDRTPPPLHTTATPPVCPSKRAHTTRRFCPQRTRFSFAVGSNTMRPVPNRRLGQIWALLEHKNLISGVISCRLQRGWRRHSTPAR